MKMGEVRSTVALYGDKAGEEDHQHSGKNIINRQCKKRPWLTSNHNFDAFFETSSMEFLFVSGIFFCKSDHLLPTT